MITRWEEMGRGALEGAFSEWRAEATDPRLERGPSPGPPTEPSVGARRMNAAADRGARASDERTEERHTSTWSTKKRRR